MSPKTSFEDFLDIDSLPWSATVCNTPLNPADDPCFPMAWYIFGTSRERLGAFEHAACAVPVQA